MAKTTLYAAFINFRERSKVYPVESGNFGIYLGTDDGDLLEYNGYNDLNFPIAAWWKSKELDFSEQFPQYSKDFKTIDRIELEYVDEIENTPITVAISGDGGITWEFKSRLLGTGSGKQKFATFHFSNTEESTAVSFRMQIMSIYTATKFTWTGAHIWFEPRGPAFEIS
jgi:hypothetical protein